MLPEATALLVATALRTADIVHLAVAAVEAIAVAVVADTTAEAVDRVVAAVPAAAAVMAAEAAGKASESWYNWRRNRGPEKSGPRRLRPHRHQARRGFFSDESLKLERQIGVELAGAKT